MGKVPEEKIEQKLDLYRRWRIDGENIYSLLPEFNISYKRAYDWRDSVNRWFGINDDNDFKKDELHNMFEAYIRENDITLN